MDLDPGTYRINVPNFTQLKAPTLWEDLAAQDRRFIVINLPSTYPAREIKGVLLSGFVAIDLNKAVFRSSLVLKLRSMDYRIDIDAAKAREDFDFLFQELDKTLECRERAANFCWNESIPYALGPRVYRH